jgi:transcriptional regulator with XRE-family HTH domain
MNHFKAARLLVGLTQKEAARRTKLSQAAISELETGDHTSPLWETIGRLSTLYRCSPFELLPLRFKPKPAPRRLLLRVDDEGAL